MFRLIGLVISIGLADSLNPTTIAPALYMATGERSRERLTEFTIAVFAVYFLGGAIIALGPGQLLLALVPRPNHATRHLLEVIAGVAMIVASFFLWRFRVGLSNRDLPATDSEGKSSALLGATITAVELPTAFPYFAAIAAIVGSGLDPARQVFLLVLFNVCFVLPLIGIVLTVAFAGERAEQILTSSREWLQAHWPTLLAVVALTAGVIVVLLGTVGLAGSHSRFSRFVHHLLKLKA